MMDSEAAETLIRAIQNRDREAVRRQVAALIATGFDINSPLPDPPNAKRLSWAAIFWVVQSGDEELLSYFLYELKVNPNVKDVEGRNPAHKTVHCLDRSHLLRALVLNGCDATEKDNYGLDLIDLARCNYGIGTRDCASRTRLAVELYCLSKQRKKLFLLFCYSHTKSGFRRLTRSVLGEIIEFMDVEN